MPINSDGSRHSDFWTPVVACILATETAERFAFFGFRAVLVLYFTKDLQYDDNTAISLFAYMTSLAYFSPLLGAFMADGYLGRYTTILSFLCIYAVGMVLLTLGVYLEEDETLEVKRNLTFVGLFLICLGTGGIKPCVAAFGADQVAHPTDSDLEAHMRSKRPETTPSTTEAHVADTHESERVRAFFASFYFCINVGSIASILLIPILRDRFGFGLAFLTPTLFIFVAMGAFVSKRKEYVNELPDHDGKSLLNTFRLCGSLLSQQLRSNPIFRHCELRRPHQSPLRPSGECVPLSNEAKEEGKMDSTAFVTRCCEDGTVTSATQQLNDATQALRVLPVMCLLPIFWMLYDQQGSVWILQAERMSLHGLQPEQLSVVNPVQIMLFIPLFDQCIYPALETRGWNTSHLRRMAWGMFLASMSFFVSGFLERAIEVREARGIEQLNVLWQLPQITLLTIAEIFVSVTGLEFAYASAPDRMKAFLMALFLLTTAVGDFFGGIMYSSVFQRVDRATAMHVCAILMLWNLALFCWVERRWEQSLPPYSRTGEVAGVKWYGTVERTLSTLSHGFEMQTQQF